MADILITGGAPRAARLYGSPRGAGSGAGPLDAGGAAARPSFSDLMKDGVAGAVDAVRQGDQAALRGVQGKESAQRVVEAVLAAEMTLQTVVAVRDRMVSAYQELMRMPI